MPHFAEAVFTDGQAPYVHDGSQAVHLVNMEQHISMISKYHEELVELASRMDGALSALVKCLPQRKTAISWKSEELNEAPGKDMSSAKSSYVQDRSEASLPMHLQTELPDGLHGGSLRETRAENNYPVLKSHSFSSLGSLRCPSQLPVEQMTREIISHLTGVLQKEVKVALTEFKNNNNSAVPEVKNSNFSLQTSKVSVPLSPRPQNHTQSQRSAIPRSSTMSLSIGGDSQHGSVTDIQPRVMTSCSGTMEESFAFDCANTGEIDAVCEFLGRKGDPNLTLYNVTVGRDNLTHCSIVGAAIHGGHTPIVELLVNARADLASTYGFIPPSSDEEWSGSTAFITVIGGDLATLQCLLLLRVDLETLASNGGNLVWQAACSGNADVMQLLLTEKVDCELSATSQDSQGIGYTPLHVAVNAGYTRCVKALLDANAQTNYTNEENASPLDGAIRNCHPGIVQLLVKAGAQLVEKLATGDEPSLNVLFQTNNPVLVRAAALGLQSQPSQVKRMSRQDFADLIELPGAPKIELLRALFCSRRLKKRGAKREVIQLKTAIVDKFPHVALWAQSYSDLDAVFKSRQDFDADMIKFLDAIVPQQPSRYNPYSNKVHTPIKAFECLVTGVQHDLRVIRALSECEPFDSIWLEMPCQAIMRVVWLEAKWIARIEVADHLLLLILFLELSYLTMSSHEQLGDLIPGFNDTFSTRSVAMIGVPLWLVEFGKEFIEFAAYVEQGWFVNYVTDYANALDVGRVIADGVLLYQFLSGDSAAYAAFYFRIWFASCCFLKWTKLVYTLSSFRKFGFQVLPILFTLNDIGSFVTIMLFYLAGVGHAFAATDFLCESTAETYLNSFYFGIMGDVEKIEKIYQASGNNSWTKSAFLLLIGFAVPITLMNIFIAALSSSYEHGIAHQEHLYQNRVARTVLSQACIKHMMARICCRNSHLSGYTSRYLQPKRLWYLIDYSKES